MDSQAAKEGVPQKVSVDARGAHLKEAWRPEILAEANGQELKLARLHGAFPWHRHVEEDEVFLGVQGRFKLEFRAGSVEIGPGELVVVPKGVEHRPVADEPALAMLFEPKGVKNTGDVDDPVYTIPT